MHLHTPSTLLSLLLLATSATPKPVTIPIAPATKAALAAASSNPNASPAGCTDTSFNSFAWLARSFDYHASYVFTTPAHQNSWGFASFDLFNPADKTTAKCEARSSQLQDFFYGTVAYQCDDAGANGGEGRLGKTSFDFSRPEGRVRVNQTWGCDDREPEFPYVILFEIGEGLVTDEKHRISFTGRGDLNLTLDCTETFYQNPNWTMGQIYSSRDIKCAVIDEAKVIPFEMSAIA